MERLTTGMQHRPAMYTLVYHINNYVKPLIVIHRTYMILDIRSTCMGKVPQRR